MKRQMSLLLALAMLLLLALACSGDTSSTVMEAAQEAADAAVTEETPDEAQEDTELTAEAELTADSLLAAMQEYMENASGMTMDMIFTMDMTIEGERVVTDMGYTYQVTSDPEAAHVSVTVTYEADYEDESMVTTTETYVVLEDGVYVTYSGVDGDWYKMEIELDADLMESYTMLDMTTGCTLAEETQKVNGTECFVLTCQLQVDDLQTLFEEMGLTSLTGEIDYSALTVEETIWLDTETLLPVQSTIDFGDSLTAMMEASIGLAGEDGIEFSMEPCVITASYTGFNNVDEITVPEEVIESAVSYDELYDLYEGYEDYESDNYELTQSEDGIYILEDGYSDVTVSIATPVGYVIDEDTSDSTWLCFELDDDSSYAWAYYSLYTDYTAEDMEYIYGDDFEIYEEFFADVEISGPETVTVGGRNVTYLRVIYTYDNGDRCLDFDAWVEMAEDVQVMIGGYEYDYDVDFSALLETLVDAIQ